MLKNFVSYSEVLMLARFVFVGGSVAVIHIGLALTFLFVFKLSPIASNVLAFIIAFIFSFVGQYYWTFKSSVNKKKALLLYFLASVLGFVANNVVLIYMIEMEFVAAHWSIVLSACVIPVVTYTVSRLFIFK